MDLIPFAKGLQLNKFVIVSLSTQELVVSSSFADGTFLYEVYAISVLNRRQTMGYGDSRPSARGCIEGGLYHFLRV
jgi:hypothetical protein